MAKTIGLTKGFWFGIMIIDLTIIYARNNTTIQSAIEQSKLVFLLYKRDVVSRLATIKLPAFFV